MAHFAKLDENNVVTEVIVVNNETATDEATGVAFLKDLYKEPDAVWKQTSYNTKEGKYWDNSDPTITVEHPDQSRAFRLNYAGVGWIWNEELQGFIDGSQPHASWTLNSSTGYWEPPIAPIGVPYIHWNEEAYQADNTKGWADAEGNLG